VIEGKDATVTTPDGHIDESVPFADYVIAVLDDRPVAEAAVKALQAGGFNANDIVVSTPGSALQKPEHQAGTLANTPTAAQKLFATEAFRHRSFSPQKLFATEAFRHRSFSPQKLFAEEGIDHEVYATARGHTVIHVHTQHSAEVERARTILVAQHVHNIQHAHNIRRVGHWTRETLPEV
jgi:hypothetical protein